MPSTRTQQNKMRKRLAKKLGIYDYGAKHRNRKRYHLEGFTYRCTRCRQEVLCEVGGKGNLKCCGKEMKPSLEASVEPFREASLRNKPSTRIPDYVPSQASILLKLSGWRQGNIERAERVGGYIPPNKVEEV